MISHSKLSPVVRESNKDIINTFRDSYVFEFLNLPEPHNESDLKQGLISQMKKFILELGKDYLSFNNEIEINNKAVFSTDTTLFAGGIQPISIHPERLQ